MKKMTLLFALIGANVISACQMPSEDELQERLHKQFRYFNEKTHLSRELANQKLSCSDVFEAVETAHSTFYGKIDGRLPRKIQEGIIFTAEMNKSFLVKLLLKDCSPCLKEFEAAVLFQTK